MPPKKAAKKGNKKGKGGDDSDLEWESSLKPATQTQSADTEGPKPSPDDHPEVMTAAAPSLTSLLMNVDEDGNDLGGLMSAIANSKSKTKKAKKGRRARGDDDDEEDAAAILAALDAKAENDEDDVSDPSPSIAKKSAKKGNKKPSAQAFSFAALADEDEPASVHDNEDDNNADVPMKPVPSKAAEKSNKNKKNSKSKATPADDDDDAFDDSAPLKNGSSAKTDASTYDGDDGDTSASAPSKPAQAQQQGKKAKKGKNKKETNFDDEMDLLAAEIENNVKVTHDDVNAADKAPSAPAPVQPAATTPTKKPAESPAADESESHVKSKKEKERERKERQKLAKQQQQQKQQTSRPDSAALNPVPTPSSAPAPAPTSGKRKGPAGVAALREALAARNAAEAEARRIEEEERKRIEEEERIRQEEERQKEEAKLRKKERERQKKEELKKSGKYFTPAQKAQQAQARAKLEAMIAAGIKIDALAASAGSPGTDAPEKKPKRVVYASKKKGNQKNNNAADQKPESSVDASESPSQLKKALETEPSASADQAPDSWDAESDADGSSHDAVSKAAVGDGEVDQSGIKDSWEEESDGESKGDAKDNWDDDSEDEKPAPKPVPKQASKPVVVAAAGSTKVDTGAPSAPSRANGSATVSKKPQTGKAIAVASVVDKKAPVNANAVSQKSDAKSKPVAKEDEEEEDDDDDGEEDDDDDDEDDEDDDDDDDDEDEDDELSVTQKLALQRKEEASARRKERIAAAMAARSKDDLRSPICCILGHVDTGKCFGRDTPLLMSDGTVRLVQDIKENDLLLGDDCTPRVVKSKSLVHERGELYRITPETSSGHESFVCNDEHILVLVCLTKPWIECKRVRDRQMYEVVSMQIDRLTNTPQTQSLGQFSSRRRAVAALPQWQPLIWEPSVLKYLSVDQHIRSQFAMYKPVDGIEYPADASELTSLIYSVMGSNTDLMVAASWLMGLILGARDLVMDDNILQIISSTEAAAIKAFTTQCNTIADEHSASTTQMQILLEKLGMIDSDRIPDAILRSTKSQRLAVLAGIVDALACTTSEGDKVRNSGLVVSSKRLEFLRDTSRLARSLGLRASDVVQADGHDACWRVVIGGSGLHALNDLVRIKSKRMPHVETDTWQSYCDNSTSFTVESLGEGEYFGFTVFGANSRFLLGDFTVTHNTKLLDKIRQTNVQEGEAGGITQQIGATYFPMDAIIQKTALLHKDAPADYRLPGLLVIDTPGHESFTNLRSRGSSLCNIAVLVVDIVHGLEPQTIESLNLLRQRKTPFIVALNKIDRMFDWQANANFPTRDTLALQKPHVIKEFQDRVNKVIVEFAEQGLNACLYWENKNVSKYVSLVPTSAITGEGIPDLLHLLVDLTQTRMTERLMYLSELECTVLEVKVIEGLGTTIDVVLSNGVIHEGDRICLCGLNGPIVTNIRALLTPQPMRELRIKSAYVHHKSVKASLGVKISAPDLEKAIAGSRMLVIGEDDDEDEIKEEVMGDLTNLMSSIDKSGKGVCVQASTLGSLEALLVFLKSSNIPVSGINIGPVHKKDVIRTSVMLERAPEYAQLLAFDVPVDKDAADLAQDMGIKIFTANIIYHLFDAYTKYMKDLEEQRRKDAAPIAIFPALLRMVPGAVFNKRGPIIIGVDVAEGVLKIGTPLCVVNKETQAIVGLGKVSGIELDHKPRQEIKRGGPSVAIRIESPGYDAPKMYGRHFTEENEIYSHITRASIDILKTTFRNDLSRDEWALVVKLKKFLKID